MRVCVATAEDTIVAKLEWAQAGESERQLRDVVGILEMRRGELDLDYVERWIRELNLAVGLGAGEVASGDVIGGRREAAGGGLRRMARRFSFRDRVLELKFVASRRAATCGGGSALFRLRPPPAASLRLLFDGGKRSASRRRAGQRSPGT